LEAAFNRKIRLESIVTVVYILVHVDINKLRPKINMHCYYRVLLLQSLIRISSFLLHCFVHLYNFASAPDLDVVNRLIMIDHPSIDIRWTTDAGRILLFDSIKPVKLIWAAVGGLRTSGELQSKSSYIGLMKAWHAVGCMWLVTAERKLPVVINRLTQSPSRNNESSTVGLQKKLTHCHSATSINWQH